VTQVGQEQRRKQLIDAATRVIREQGLSRATTRRIAEYAGAPLPSLHYCFRDKDELYAAVMASLNIKGQQRLQHSATPGMGVANAAAMMIRGSAMWNLETYADQLTEIEIYIWAKRTKRCYPIPADTYRQWLRLAARLCENARRKDEPEYDYDAISRMIVACIDGLMIQDQMLDEQQMVRMAEHAAVTLALAIRSGQFNTTTSAERPLASSDDGTVTA
jgi:TetR/AcrR family transcriptional regulator, regulator of biofilm formation and stress response